MSDSDAESQRPSNSTMMYPSLMPIWLALAAHAAAQGSSTSPIPEVPTGTPIPGDYTGQYRPQIHFSAPEYFINDPNGMFVDENGTWHLYYQYNPTDYVAGNQHWGHATSEDLYHWENQPIALFPPDDNTFIFSGSAVTDPNNTSGFFPDQTNGVVAIYTLAELPPGGEGPQTQAIAYSRDGGYTFTPYENNPVIPSESSQFRDPKVIWYEDRWVMVVAYAQEFAMGIFTSPDLIDWTATSNFSYHGLIGHQYECPNMIRMPYIDEDGEKQDDMWLMYISINPGAPYGGSIGEYFPGTFNGTHFEAVDAAARIADFGKDNYAGQWFYGTDDDDLPVSIAWASNWQYTNEVPTEDEKWRGAMSLPRRNYLTKVERIGWKMVSEPYDMSPVMGKVLASNESMGNSNLTVDFADLDSNAIHIEANLTAPTDGGSLSEGVLRFDFTSPKSGESLYGGYHLGRGAFFINRGGVNGYEDDFFTEKFSMDLIPSEEEWTMTVVMDRSLLEVFIDGGVESATNVFFSEEPLTELSVSARDFAEGVGISVRVNALNSAWAAMSDAQGGLVHGNRTSS